MPLTSTPAAADCHDVYTHDYFGDYTVLCDVYTEADLRGAAAQGYGFFGSKVITLHANITSSGQVDFGGYGFTLNTNGFDLTGSFTGVNLYQVGAGTLTFIGSVKGYTYEWGFTDPASITVSQGMLRLSADQPSIALGLGGHLSNGVTLQAGGSFTIAGSLRLSEGYYLPERGWVVFGPLLQPETIDTNGFTVAITGQVYGSGRLVKVGSGTLVLSGANTSVGGVLVKDGILRVSSDRSLGVLATDSLTDCGFTSCNLPRMAAPLALDGGTLQAGAAFTIARPIILGPAGGAFDTSGFQLTVATVDGPGGLKKVGDGTLMVTGPATYAGPTIVNAGTLQLAGPGALPAATVLTVAEGARLDGGGQTLSLGSLSGGGSVLLGNGSLSVGTNNLSTLFAGVISGAGGMTKTGTGVLTFSSPQTYTGLTEISAGRLHVAGLGGSVLVNAAGTLSGSGTIAGSAIVQGALIPGMPGTPGGSLSPAPLIVSGDLLLGPSATYAVAVGQGNGTPLQVGGHTTIDGAQLALVGLGSKLPRVTTLPLFTSRGGVSGQFSAIDAPGPFDSFLAVRGSTAYAILERTDLPLTSLATTENGRAAGAALDVARRTASVDLRTVIREVMGLSDPNVSGALAQLGGSIAATALRTGALDAENVIRSVSGRLIDLRTGVRSDLTRSTVGAARLSTGVWFRASGGGISGDTINSNLRLQGGLLGVDRQVAGGRWSVGAFGGYDRAVLDVDAGANTIRDRRYRAGVYATTTVGAAYLDAAVAGASHRFETTRHLAFVAQLDPQFGGGPLFGGIDRLAAARYAGRDVTSFIESGVSRTLGQVFLQPFVGLDASRVSSDGFSESGSGSIDLVVADATTASLRAAVGLRAGRGFTASNGRLFAPRAELRYLHELLSPMATMQAAFADASSIPFAIQSPAYGRHAVSISPGFVASIGRGLMLSLDYRGDFAPTDRTHSVTFGVAF